MPVKYFLVILAFIIIFLGCGGGGGDSGVGPALVSGQISGSIIFDEALASERAAFEGNLEKARASSFNQAIVFIEEMPNMACYPDNNGNYLFDDLPFDMEYHIIARINSVTGRVYKLRTEAIPITSDRPQLLRNLIIRSTDEAKYQIRLQVKDTKDNSVGHCNVWLWGEEFTVDEGGCYLSPRMPLGASGLIKVIPQKNTGLATLECNIDSSTFTSEIQGVSSVTLTPEGITKKKAPYVSVRVGEILPGGASIRIYGSARDPQNDLLAYEWETDVSSFTFTSYDKSYVEWVIPSEPVNAVIKFKAKQISSTLYPYLSSFAELAIRVSKNGTISFPGEIVITPSTRSLDIVSSSTAQITGDSVCLYEAVASFPNDLPLKYSWSVTEGSFVSETNRKQVLWKTPTLKAGESKVASLTANVSDGIATVSKTLSINITPFPVVIILSPGETQFYPGFVEFNGLAIDYKGEKISEDNYSWCIATGTEAFEGIAFGVATFSYYFSQRGSYTVALEAKDLNGCVGTATKDISIANSSPIVKITNPKNDAGFAKGKIINFSATVNDIEEGEITDASRILWYSSLDDKIGSGTSFSIASLSKGMHVITCQCADLEGAIGSDSITLWYDMPARITLSMEDKSVFFAGSPVYIEANGVDMDNSPLDINTYNWYLDGSTAPYKTGVASFSFMGLASGTHRIKVVGRNKTEEISSPECVFEVGWPLPEIVLPVSPFRNLPGENCSFVATPKATGTMILQWFINDTETPVSSEASFTTTLTEGNNVIYYSGTDSAGVKKSASMNIITEAVPTISFSPASSSIFFISHDIDFVADCRDGSGNAIEASSIKWYLDGAANPWHGGSRFAAKQGDGSGYLTPGSHTITLTASGKYGTVASLTKTIRTGVDAASILKPESYATFAVNESFEVSGLPDDGLIPMQWYLNGVKISTAASFTHKFTASGTYEFKLIGTDSANITSADTKTVVVGLFPAVDYSLQTLAGTEVNADMSVVFEDQDIILIASATDPLNHLPISAANLTWYIYNDSGLPQELPGHFQNMTLEKSLLANYSPGYRKIELRATNSTGATGKCVKQIYLNLPKASIEYPVKNAILPLDTLNPTISAPFIASGTPESVSPVDFEWWIDWGRADASRLSDVDSGATSGSIMKIQLPKGIQNLTYIATDSIGQISRKDVNVVVSDSENLLFTPQDGGVLFKDIDFTANIISGAFTSESVKWHFSNGVATETVTAPPPFLVTESMLSAYSNKYFYMTVEAENSAELKVVSSTTNRLYYGLEHAFINNEDSKIYPIGSVQTFTATPTIDPAYAIHAEKSAWFCDDVLIAGSTDKASLNYAGPSGRHVLTYVATDSADNTTQHSINIIFDDPPTIGFSPSNDYNSDAYVFNGGSFALIATGTASVDPDDPANEIHSYKWYVNNALVTMDKSSVDVAELGLIGGQNVVTLTGEDQFNNVGTHSHKIFYDELDPMISSPIQGQRFNEGQDITLVGNMPKYITFEWYLNGVYKGNTNTYTIASNDPDLRIGMMNQVRYTGTDSAGIMREKNVQFLVSNEPSLDIWLPNNALMTDGNAFFAGKSIMLTASGTSNADNSPIPGSNMTWYIDDVKMTASSSKYTPSTDLTGSHKVGVTAFDQFGTLASASFYVTFGAAKPTIVQPGDDHHYTRTTPVDNVTIEGNLLTSPITSSWAIDGIVDGTQTTNIFSKQTNEIGKKGYVIFTYSGVDSAGNEESATKRVIIVDYPIADFTPGDESAILDGQGFNLVATVTQDDSGKGGITYSWFKDSVPLGNNQNQKILGDNSVLTTGFNNIVLRTEDYYGITTEVTKRICWKYPGGKIDSPANNRTYPEDTGPIEFVGSTLYNPDFITASNNVTYEWGLRKAGNVLEVKATGNTATFALERGSNSIFYRTTDSFGNAYYDYITLVCNNSPTVEILVKIAGVAEYVSGSPCFFGGKQIELVGSATENVNRTLLDGTHFEWFLDGASKGSGNRQIYNASTLATGSHILRLVATDELGTSGEMTMYFDYGHVVASITYPANNETFDIGSTVNFTAQAADASMDKIPMQWFVDGVSQGAPAVANYNMTKTFPAAGSYKITYIGTDSAGISTKSEINIAIDNAPTLEIETDQAQPAMNAIYYTMAGGNTINLIGSGTGFVDDYVLRDSDFTWTVREGTGIGGDIKYGPRSGMSQVTLNRTYLSNPGTYTAILDGKDQFGASATKMASFYYGYPDPKMISPASNATYTIAAGTAGINFQGNSLNNVPLTHTWTRENLSTSAVETLGTGYTLTGQTFSPGYYKVSYSAVDSAGVASSTSVRILVDDEPDSEITLSDGLTSANRTAFYSVTNPTQLYFWGKGTGAVSSYDVPASKMSWKLYQGEGTGGSQRSSKSGTTSVGFVNSDFGSVGTFTLALTVSDQFGYASTSTSVFYYGVNPPVITSPANNAQYQHTGSNVTVNFIGNNDSNAHVTTDWYYVTDTGTEFSMGFHNQSNANYSFGLGSYTIIYRGEDSAGARRESRINIVVDSAPSVEMKLDNGNAVQNAVFFTLSGSTKITVKGNATASIGLEPIASSNMNWRLYRGTGASKTLRKTYTGVGYIEMSSSELNAADTYTLEYEARDKYGYINTQTETFYYGYTLPVISSPTAGAHSISEGSNLTLTGTNDTHASLTMKWYRSDQSASIGSGYQITGQNFGRGSYTVTYIGTDTAGIERSASQNFYVNDAPIINITTPSGKYFGGQTLTFSGTANKSGGAGALDASNITWYRSTSTTGTEKTLGSGNTTISVSANDIGTGTWYIRMVGKDSDFGSNLTNSSYIQITTGVDYPKITGPASGTRYDIGSSIKFIGNNIANDVSMTWSSDDSHISGTASQTSTTTLARGWRKIYYSGTDSNGTNISTYTMVLVDTRPTFTVAPHVTNSYTWTGRGSATGVSYPIFILPRGTMINLQTAANNSASSAIASITWIDMSQTTRQVVAGSTVNPNSFNMNINPGSYTYSIVAEDEFGIQASTTYSFWIWNCETYDGYAGADAMLSTDESTLFIATGTSGVSYQLNLMSRQGGSSASGVESGDVSVRTGSNIDSWTPGYYMMGLDFYNSYIYTMSGDRAGNLLLQKWKASDLNTSSDDDLTSFPGASLNNIGDIAYSGGSLYVTDKTNNYVKKLSSSSGAFDIKSEILSNPTGIKYVDDNSIFVADTGNNRVLKMNSDCNITAVYSGVTSPSYLTYSTNSKKLYVTSASGAKVWVIDTVSGAVLYSFGETGSGTNQPQFAANGACDIAISGTNTRSDLYISDKVNGRIIRVRCGLTW